VITAGLITSSCSIRVPCKGVATVVYPGGALRNPVLEYYVGGKRYIAKAPRQRFLVQGEKFELLYDSLNPYKVTLLTEKPVFMSHEKKLYTVGEIIRCISGPYTKVLFSYFADGKRYKKLQVIEGPFYAKKGAPCEISYWAEYPQRAILEKPMN